MRRGTRGGQRGIALLALLAVLVIGGTWYLVSRLQELSANRTAIERARNAAVLNRAKQALIGYVIAQANHANENNPGALPCPEAPASFNDLTGTDGKTNTGGCAGPAVGRFPWRTIGTDKLVDAAGEPLWYVVSSGWAVTCSSCTTTLNSNSTGQLTVDGVAPASLAASDTVIALLIAPGLPFSVPAATGCTAWSQARPATPDVPPDVRNYLECDNSNGDSSFVTTGPSGSFNDQVLKVTVGDLMPGLEAAIANRIEREIVPQIRTMYGSTWGVTNGNEILPYPAAFGNPDTSNYQGASATSAGFLPVTSDSCSGDPRCTGGGASNFVSWNTGSNPTLAQTGGTGALCTGSGTPAVGCLLAPICWWNTTTEADCIAMYVATGWVTVAMTAQANNVAMAMRKLDTSQVTVQYFTGAVWQSVTASASGTFLASGAANVSASGTVPASGSSVLFLWTTMNLATIADHDIINSANSTYGWFVRNQWHRLTYYRPAPGYTTGTAPTTATPSCTTGTSCSGTCLCLTTNSASVGGQRGLLILAGASLNGNTRPTTSLSDYLEFGNVNATGQATAPFQKQTVTNRISYAYADNGGANAYSITLSSVPTGVPIFFKVKAGGTNNGASTLTTAATGAKNIVNSDGTPLTSPWGQIQGGTVVQVIYDGAQFLLSKRPFNDRVIVIDSQP